MFLKGFKMTTYYTHPQSGLTQEGDEQYIQWHENEWIPVVAGSDIEFETNLIRRPVKVEELEEVKELQSQLDNERKWAKQYFKAAFTLEEKLSLAVEALELIAQTEKGTATGIEAKNALEKIKGEK
jgi:hypothetical protein